MPIGDFRNPKRDLDTARDMMRRIFNCRPVTEADIKPGGNAIMVDIQRFIKQGGPNTKIGEAGTTAIKLTYAATRIKGLHGREKVQYTCIDSPNSPIISLPLDEFLRDEYTPLGVYSSDTRFFVTI